MSKPVKVSEETHEYLTALSQSTKMNMGVIIDYLVDVQQEHNLLDPDWLETLLEDRMSDFIAKKDIDLQKKIEFERAKVVNRAKFEAFKQYLNVLEPETKKAFLENILGDVESEGFLDSISNYQMFNIDGLNKLCQLDETGLPIVPGVNMAQIIACDNGYHTIGGFCKCNKWRTCKIRSQEYLTYLSNTDPNMSKAKTRRFVEGSIVRRDPR